MATNQRCGLAAVISALLVALLFLGERAQGGEPAGYYNSATGLTGNALRNALHNIIDNHTVIPHSGGSFDTRDAIDFLQQDPSNSQNVVLVYSGFSVAKSSWPDYNREHVWPVSLGAAQGTPCYSDVFNILGCDADVNSSRGNKYFDECNSGCNTHPEAPQCFFDLERFEPRAADKGNIARILFYLDVRYSGDVAGEPDLQLGDMATSIGCDCMGLLDTLLLWHAQDPPDAAEALRNDRVFSQIQGNRNPFVDHPEYVSALYGGDDPPPVDGDAWINEIHYDNVGGDVNEGVEIAGVAGVTLAGWQLVPYNGSTGFEYDPQFLAGVIPDEGNGFGALWFPIALQNGSPDGIALIDGSGVLVQFVSYEGELVALDGQISGSASVDIDVSETNVTAVGNSLQLTGAGIAYSDFTWSAPSPHSRGLLNVGQSLGGSNAPEWIRGDCGDDGSVGLPDALSLLGYLFTQGVVVCEAACDVIDDGALGLTDALYLLNYLFSGGTPPTAPFASCGPDPTVDLACAATTSCP